MTIDLTSIEDIVERLGDVKWNALKAAFKELDDKYETELSGDNEVAFVEALNRLWTKMKPILEDVDAVRRAAAHSFVPLKDPPEQGTPLEDFFTSVGDALIDAQDELDRNALPYLRRSATRPHAVPSVFRIPKVSAEIKFELSRGKESGVNLIFHKTKEDVRELHQQSVRFDIVAVPPPPEAVARIAEPAPNLPLLIDPARRKAFFERLDALPRNTVPDRLKSAKGRAYMIIGIVGPADYILALAQREKKLGIWRINQGETPSVRAVMPYDASWLGEEAAGLKKVHEALLKACIGHAQALGNPELALLMPSPKFVFDPGPRRSIFTAVRNFEHKVPGLRKDELLDDPDRVVVMAGGSDGVYYLAKADSGGLTRIGVWRLNIGITTREALMPVLVYRRRQGLPGRPKYLHGAVLDFGMRQLAYLRP